MKLLEVYLTPIDERRFQAIATQSPVGGGSAESSLPFWDGPVDRRTTLIKLLELSGGFFAKAFPDPDEQAWMEHGGLLTSDRNGFAPAYLEKVGQVLYEALFPVGSALRSTFESALRAAEQDGVELHVRLKYAAQSAQRSRLADYPWELLHDGQRFLLHRDIVLSRYLDYESLAPSLPAQDHLNVLLISSPASDPSQGLGQLPDLEQQAIREGMTKAQADQRMTLTQLPQVTRKGLSAYLTDCSSQDLPQVIHFDGHGLYGKRCTNPDCRQLHNSIKVERCRRCQQALPEAEGFLLFEDEQGKPDYVSAREFAVLLPKSVALVVLSACQSGMAVAGESLFNGTAQQLIDLRIPAVVAMQYLVRVDAASQFAEQFYRVLGKREPLTTALQEGRKWMMPQLNQWYRPVLYLRWQDNEGGQLFTSVNEADSDTGLRLSQRLELGRLQQDLEDLEQDYESVKDRLRTESNPRSRNQLIRQHDQIISEMDQCEQKISRLRQNDE